MNRILTAAFFLLLPFGAFAAEIGAPAPAFTLPGADGASVSLANFKNKIVVLEWMNLGCPYVRKHYDGGHMQGLQDKYTKQGVVWLTINSTNAEHGDFVPPEKRVAYVQTNKLASTAYLSDEKGEAGKSYGAKTTPHIFIVDAAGKLVYRGAIDDSPMKDPAGAKNYLTQALDELLAGKPVSEPDTKAYGCSVKYL